MFQKMDLFIPFSRMELIGHTRLRPPCPSSKTANWRFFDPLLGHGGAICRCPRRPKGRSWPRTDPESGNAEQYGGIG
jgi:hypothetical protein